jgi:putative SOS response-associated peptidase YedK
MCGRFYVPEKDIDDFSGLVNQVEKELIKKAGEICPGDYAPIITPVPKASSTHEKDSSIFDCHAIKWGFPSQNGRPLINARSETVQDKPLFKLPFATRRCLIPARGFFEWMDSENSKKRIKHYITFFDAQLMYFAGLYWFFKDKNGINNPYFTIITTQANSDVQRIHERMPVIIRDCDKPVWLYGSESTDGLKELMVPLQEGSLKIQQID